MLGRGKKFEREGRIWPLKNYVSGWRNIKNVINYSFMKWWKVYDKLVA